MDNKNKPKKSDLFPAEKKPKKVYINVGIEVNQYTALVGIGRKNGVSEQFIIRSLILKELRSKKLID